MAKELNVRINTEYNNKGILQAQKGVQGLASTVAGVSGSVAQGFNSAFTAVNNGAKGINTATTNIARGFSRIQNPKFSFGANMVSQAAQTTQAANTVQNSVNNINRSFSRIQTPTFSFGVGGAGGSFNTLNQLPPSLNNVNNSARRVGVTFTGLSRVFQDFAFGPAAIANNLEGMFFEFRQIQNISRTTGQSIRQTLVASLTGGGGLNLALGAVTFALSVAGFGMQAWTRAFGDNNKDVSDNKQSLDEYIATLNAVSGAMLRGSVDAQKEVTDLRLLYNAATNASLGTRARTEAVEELQSLYPQYFGNQTKEAILAGEVKGVYDELTKSILASARARAAASKIAENESKVLENQSRLLDAQNKLNDVQSRINARRQIRDGGQLAAGAAGIGAGGSSFYSQTNKLLDERRKIGEEINKLAGENNKLTDSSALLASRVNVELEKGGKLTGGFGDGLDEANKKNKKNTDEFKKQVTLIEEILKNVPNISLPQFQSEGFIRGTNLSTGLDPSSSEGYTKLRNQMLADQERWADEASKNAKKSGDDYYEAFTRGVDRFSNDFLNTLTTLNQQTDQSFKGIFATISKGFLDSFNSVFTGFFTNQLKNVLQGGLDGLDLGGLGNKISKAMVAGAGLAGSIISGVTSPTSSVGQGLGGALSGAASGALLGSAVPGIGTAIGAVAGGLFGAIGGLFSASKARKQERLQEEALAEQKKQTELMERQNALAYGTNVTGRFLQGQGVISGIDFNAFGELVTRVGGKELLFVLRQAERDEARGLL